MNVILYKTLYPLSSDNLPRKKTGNPPKLNGGVAGSREMVFPAPL